jgi:hypothetical protein
MRYQQLTIAFLTLFVANFICTVIIITSMREDLVALFICTGCMFISLLGLLGLLISYLSTTSQILNTHVSSTSTPAPILSELVIVKPTSLSIEFENAQSIHIAESESSPHKVVVAIS